MVIAVLERGVYGFKLVQQLSIFLYYLLICRLEIGPLSFKFANIGGEAFVFLLGFADIGFMASEKGLESES